MKHLKSSEALLEAAKMIEAEREAYICLALNTLHNNGKISYRQCRDLKAGIMRKLEGRRTLESWLDIRVKGYSYSWTRKTRAHRVAWARQMAAEYAAKGR